MKNKIKDGVLALLFLVCVTAFSLTGLGGTPALANSAMRYFDGVDSSGLIVTTEDCPIVVDSEELTFDIETETENSRQYDCGGKVTAKYTFRNPADYTAKVGLLFPIGFVSDLPEDAEQNYMRITADGVDISKTVRYTYKQRWTDEFDYAEDAKLLCDEYVQNDFWKTDIVVYKYVYDVHATGRAVRFALTEYNGITVSDASGFEYGDDEYTHISFWLTAEKSDETSYQEKLTVYFIGEDNASFAQTAEYYDTMAFSESKKCTGSIDVVSKEAITFLDMVTEFRPEDSCVSDVDRYNAVVANLDGAYTDGAGKEKLLSTYDFKIDDDLLCWYEYELVFASGQTIVNEVTAPLFPDIDYGYEPSIYTFNYYLSPAKTWASFGEIKIRINTSYYLSEPSLDGFEKYDGYYEYVGNGLPNGELKFSVCASESPEEVDNGLYTFIIVALVIGLIVIVVIPVTIIVVVVVKVKKRKKRKAEQTAKRDELSDERIDPRDVFGDK